MPQIVLLTVAHVPQVAIEIALPTHQRQRPEHHINDRLGVLNAQDVFGRGIEEIITVSKSPLRTGLWKWAGNVLYFLACC